MKSKKSLSKKLAICCFIIIFVGALGFLFYEFSGQIKDAFSSSKEQAIISNSSNDTISASSDLISIPEGSSNKNSDNNEALEKSIENAKVGDNAKPYDKPFVPSQGFADLVEHVNPSVVNISAFKVVKQSEVSAIKDPALQELLKRFAPQAGQPIPQKMSSLGTGFVVRSDGFIVTNNHVIQGAENIQVTFTDNKKYDAVLYATDPATDIAVLKINVKNIPTLKLGSSTDIRVGDWVIAIGNPFGFGGTVSSGIVSAKGRQINLGSAFTDYLQTDAAINRGNSGGPMINTKGEVVGINTAIFSTSEGGSIGIGFAIPSDTVKKVVSQLITSKTVVRGWLGVQIQPIDDNIAKLLKLERAVGALVLNTMPDSPAAKAGLQAGDIIYSVDDKIIENAALLPQIISDVVPDTSVKMGVIRNGNKIVVDVTILKMPELKSSEKDNAAAKKTDLSAVEVATFNNIGLKVAQINPSVRKHFSMKDNVTGVVILGVRIGSIAQQKNLVSGVKIVSINNTLIYNLKDVNDAVNKYINQGLLLLVEDLAGNRQFISITKKEVTQGFVD